MRANRPNPFRRRSFEWTPVDWPIETLDRDLWVGEQGWQSNGGPQRGHPCRAKPFLLSFALPETEGQVTAIALTGVFALWASAEFEAPGNLGASVEIRNAHGDTLRFELRNGWHYRDSLDTTTVDRGLGDSVAIETIGHFERDGVDHRVDRLLFEIPPDFDPTEVNFRDLGSPASFIVFGVERQVRVAGGCPFRGHAGRVSLAEVASAVRVGDRARLQKALDQLADGLDAAHDLDEARGQCLTFLAMVTAGLIELGGTRDTHRTLLDASRALEALADKDSMLAEIHTRLASLTDLLNPLHRSASDRLIDRALVFLERHYAREVTDTEVAHMLGLSTSHFRFLFKNATGKPFHRYLIGLRLERAKEMLESQALPVSEVAAAVGFTGLAHFSRAFSQRFHVSPSAVQRASR